MIIPVKFPKDPDAVPLPPTLARLGSDEIVLIELQGSLDIDGEQNDVEEIVGTLGLDSPDRPTLTIGHHLLEGKIATLQKPFAVLSRNAPPPSAHVRSILDIASSTQSDLQPPISIKPNNATDDDGERGDEDNGSFDIVALVKRKIVFAKRPVPIVGTSGGDSGKSTSSGTLAKRL
ncbi:hypothetical protein FRB99_007297 [Tulasnella sp. 403]|nr:hypothetical protein FRB99_007297 [Tulasnella sp. 403]